ncbi:Vacuolar protein sorting-associated protein 26B-A [Termitomyces sp. Mn162]|nr:Vacuolar protein sorting-associated protein 26B-A [Termitomyces sp. Mn162]
MDGAPVRGETIPIHLLLGGNDLTPTFRDVNKFSTRCYLNLVLIDKENRRYFKQQIKSFSSGSRLRNPLRSKSIYALR